MHNENKVPLIRLAKRDMMEPWKVWCIRLASIVLALLLGGLVSCSWQSAPSPPPVEPQPLSPVAQFMVANATGATAVIEDETFGGEVRVTLEDAFLSAAGETCKRATLLSAQHEAEIIVICHNGQEGDESNPGEWRLMPRVWGKGITTP